MKEHRVIDFSAIEWEYPDPGVRSKTYVEGNRKLRLVEYTDELNETTWCTKEHIGYVLEGKMMFEFDDECKLFLAGEGIFIMEGNRHKAKVDKNEKAAVVFVEKA